MLSHHHKCMFIHIPKNAGQSIETVFLKLLDLTWETRAPLLLRENNKPEIGPPRLAHLKAYEYVEFKYISEEIFDDYFKFSFVRNPWSRLVSIYKYLGYERKMNFRKFVLCELENCLQSKERWFLGPQSDYIFSSDDELLVDFVGRFENIQCDFNFVCEKLRLPPIIVPHVNKTRRTRKISWRGLKGLLGTLYPSNRLGAQLSTERKWRDYYDDETVAHVARVYKRDIALLNYKFE